jgi:hypothetical protein
VRVNDVRGVRLFKWGQTGGSLLTLFPRFRHGKQNH